MNATKKEEPRDISMATFRKRLQHYGMFTGMGIIGDFVCVARNEIGSRFVYRYNAGTNLRLQLAYLLRERAKALHDWEEEKAHREAGLHQVGGLSRCMKCRSLTRQAEKLGTVH